MNKSDPRTTEEIAPEYELDYSKARPNRFASANAAVSEVPLELPEIEPSTRSDGK